MKILFIDKVHPLLKKELEKKKHICDTVYNKNKNEIANIIKHYDGVIIRSKIKIDKLFIDKAKNLKFIARAGSGLENIDTSYLATKQIKCYNAGDGNKQAVAEHALGMLLSLFNNLRVSDQEIREGKWNREKNRGIEIYGKKIGIIGYGKTGSTFANLLNGFGVKLLIYDKYLKKYPNKYSMEEIFKEADIISLHVPLTDETKYLINKTFINRFKKPIYLINTARGKCVKTKDLVNALKNKKINGACLDVLEYEKESFEEIIQYDTNLNYIINSNKVILSPHIAGWTIESNIKIAKILLKKIISDFD